MIGVFWLAKQVRSHDKDAERRFCRVYDDARFMTSATRCVTSKNDEVSPRGRLTSRHLCRMPCLLPAVPQMSCVGLLARRPMNGKAWIVSGCARNVMLLFLRVPSLVGSVSQRFGELSLLFWRAPWQSHRVLHLFARVLRLFDRVSDRFKRVSDQFDWVSDRFNRVSGRFNRVTDQSNWVSAAFNRVREQFNQVSDLLNRASDRFNRVLHLFNRMSDRSWDVCDWSWQLSPWFRKVLGRARSAFM